MVIQVVEPDSPLLDHVIRLGDENSATLGFLPVPGYRERAATGTLLADVERGMLRGYVLYDLPRNDIRIIHLCVDRTSRGRGVARRLVAELRSRHHSRRGIFLHCRTDYSVNDVWPHLDFVPLAEKPGRSKVGHLLTLWWRDFGHPDLFSWRAPETERIQAALDSNVFFDLDDARDGGEQSEALRSPWIGGEAELVVTSELMNNIASGADPRNRKRQRDRLGEFRQVHPPPEEWRPHYEALVRRLRTPRPSKQVDSDLRHLAMTGAEGIPYFITRDEGVLNKFGPMAQGVCGVTAITPSDFVRMLDEVRRGNSYRPIQLRGTSLRLEPARSGELDLLTQAFLNMAQGEKASAFKNHLRTFLAAPDRWEVMIARTRDDDAVAMFARTRQSESLLVELLRVARGPLATTIARQIAFLQREYATSEAVRRVVVTDRHAGAAVASGLMAEAFTPLPDGWESLNLPACASSISIAQTMAAQIRPIASTTNIESILAGLRDSNISPTIAAELEQRFWPLKIADALLLSILIPIGPAYAEDLFDTELSSQTLFDRPLGLAMSREHVYYRNPSGTSGVAAPARILWYVSGERDRPGTQAVRASSRLEEVVIDRPRTLHRRFSHLGVYSLARIQDCSDGRGRVMALRFADTELFRHPVQLTDLRRLAKHYDCQPFLQAPWKLPQGLFADIYAMGTGS